MKRYLFILLFCHSIILVSGCATKPVVVDKPLTELIQPETSPQRAASLRLTEEGKAYLQSGNLIKASPTFKPQTVISMMRLRVKSARVLCCALLCNRC